MPDDQLSDPDEIQKIMNSLYQNVASKHLVALAKVLGGFFVT